MTRRTITIIRREEKEILYCDRCGKKMPYYTSCYACGRIFCDRHKPKEIEGGYGLPFCPRCTPKVRELSIEMKDIEIRREEIIEAFFEAGGRGRKKRGVKA